MPSVAPIEMSRVSKECATGVSLVNSARSCERRGMTRQIPIARCSKVNVISCPQIFSIATPRCPSSDWFDNQHGAMADSSVCEGSSHDFKAFLQDFRSPGSTADVGSLGECSSASSSASESPRGRSPRCESPREGTNPSNSNQVATLIMHWEAAEAVRRVSSSTCMRRTSTSAKRFSSRTLEQDAPGRSMDPSNQLTDLKNIPLAQGTPQDEFLETLRELREVRLKTAEALCKLHEYSGPEAKAFAYSLRDVNQSILCRFAEEAAKHARETEFWEDEMEPAPWSAVSIGRLGSLQEPIFAGRYSSTSSWEATPAHMRTLDEFLAEPVQTLEEFIGSQ